MNTKYEDLEIYQISEELSDRIWNLVISWDYFEKDTIGKQIVKSADSIGANIDEGSGRGSYLDYKELTAAIEGLIPRLSAFINYLNKMCK